LIKRNEVLSVFLDAGYISLRYAQKHCFNVAQAELQSHKIFINSSLFPFFMEDITPKKIKGKLNIDLYNENYFTYLNWTFKSVPRYIKKGLKHYYAEDIDDLTNNNYKNLKILQKGIKAPFSHKLYLAFIVKKCGDYYPPEHKVWQDYFKKNPQGGSFDEVLEPSHTGFENFNFAQMGSVMLQYIDKIVKGNTEILLLDIIDNKAKSFPAYYLTKSENEFAPNDIQKSIINEDSNSTFQKFDITFQAYDGKLRKEYTTKINDKALFIKGIYFSNEPNSSRKRPNKNLPLSPEEPIKKIEDLLFA